MTNDLQYVTADRVSAKGMTLGHMPLAVADADQPIGELDGIIVDPREGRVRYLVVEIRRHQKRLVPFVAARLSVRGHRLRMLISAAKETWETFDPSEYVNDEANAFSAA